MPASPLPNRRLAASAKPTRGYRARKRGKPEEWAASTFRTELPKKSQSALGEVLFARSAPALLALVSEMPDFVLREALAAPSAMGTMARLVAAGAALTPGAREIDPLAASLARSVERKRALLERAGGAMGVMEVAHLLGISRQGVDKRRKEKKLLALRSPTGDYLYPALQFTTDGDVIPHLGAWLQVCGFESAWMQLQLLMASSDTLPRRTTVRDALVSGDDMLIREALRISQTAGEPGA